MRVFLSYSRADESFVRQLREELAQRNIDTWSDSDILPGALWQEEIRKAIRSCDAIVPVLSPDSTKSTAAAAELAYALSEKWHGRGKPIIPVQARELSSPPPFLSEYQWLDMSADAPFDKLADAIVQRTGEADSYDESVRREFIDVGHTVLRHEIAQLERTRTRTANRLALTLVVLLVISLPAYLLIAFWFDFEDLERSKGWFSVVTTVLGVLAGASAGYLFGRKQDHDSEPGPTKHQGEEALNVTK